MVSFEPTRLGGPLAARCHSSFYPNGSQQKRGKMRKGWVVVLRLLPGSLALDRLVIPPRPHLVINLGRATDLCPRSKR